MDKLVNAQGCGLRKRLVWSLMVVLLSSAAGAAPATGQNKWSFTAGLGLGHNWGRTGGSGVGARMGIERHVSSHVSIGPEVAYYRLGSYTLVDRWGIGPSDYAGFPDIVKSDLGSLNPQSETNFLVTLHAGGSRVQWTAGLGAGRHQGAGEGLGPAFFTGLRTVIPAFSRAGISLELRVHGFAAVHSDKDSFLFNVPALTIKTHSYLTGVVGIVVP